MNTNQQDVDTLAVQKALANTWSDIDSTAEVHVLRTIEEAVGTARKVAQDYAKQAGADAEVMVLVTGSLHLVGVKTIVAVLQVACSHANQRKCSFSELLVT